MSAKFKGTFEFEIAKNKLYDGSIVSTKHENNVPGNTAAFLTLLLC